MTGVLLVVLGYLIGRLCDEFGPRSAFNIDHMLWDLAGIFLSITIISVGVIVFLVGLLGA